MALRVYETEGCWFEPSGVHFLSHTEITTYNFKAFVTPTKAFGIYSHIYEKFAILSKSQSSQYETDLC